MEADTKAFILSIVMIIFELWNIHQARRTGSVYLGLLSIMKQKKNKNFQVALVGNVIWTLFLIAFSARYVLMRCGIL